MSYLVLKNIRVQNATMVSSNYALTAAQPMAITLFAHALGLKTKTNFSGIGIVYHDTQPLGEPINPAHSVYRFLPQQRRAAALIDKKDYVGGSMNLSLQPVANMHLTLTLVLPIDGRAPSAARVERALASMRIAGGTILDFKQPEIIETLDELSVAPGFWLIERTDLMSAHDPIGSFINAISDPKHSWLAGACLGYALTSELSAERAGLRPNDEGEIFPHAFAEPMLGLTQFVSTWALNAKQHLPLWSHKWLLEDVFVVTNSFADFGSLDRSEDSATTETT